MTDIYQNLLKKLINAESKFSNAEKQFVQILHTGWSLWTGI